jgi:gamma-glutamyltranspeptidase/glutathione hydrolase
VKVPRGLVSRQYAEKLSRNIRLGQTIDVPSHGDADRFGTAFFGKHTTHFSTADAAGNWVACTATINTSFGSKVVIPGTGIVLNNQMDDFSAQPGVPNFFGLVGAEANAVAPRKRPLSSMSPAIVQRRGKPILSLGAAGGPTIISQTVVNLINILDYGMSPAEALARPRLHHQWKPNQLRTEALDPSAAAVLKLRGHNLEQVSAMGAAQIVAQDNSGFSGFADPRVGGLGAGW